VRLETSMHGVASLRRCEPCMDGPRARQGWRQPPLAFSPPLPSARPLGPPLGPPFGPLPGPPGPPPSWRSSLECRIEAHEGLLHSWQIMLHRSLTPNVVRHNAAISACEKGKHWEEALRLRNTALIRCCHMDLRGRGGVRRPHPAPSTNIYEARDLVGVCRWRGVCPPHTPANHKERPACDSSLSHHAKTRAPARHVVPPSPPQDSACSLRLLS